MFITFIIGVAGLFQIMILLRRTDVNPLLYRILKAWDVFKATSSMKTRNRDALYTGVNKHHLKEFLCEFKCWNIF